jgi:hypothetical protein
MGNRIICERIRETYEMKQLPIAILVLFYSFCIASQPAHGGELSLTETDDTDQIDLLKKPQ